jgi:hypothetical protein
MKYSFFYGPIQFFLIATILSCTNTNNKSDQNADNKTKQYDSTTINISNQPNKHLPDIKVNIYERRNVGRDSEGFPLEMGSVLLVKNFQEKKIYKNIGDNYIEKIEIVGNSENVSIQFINVQNNKILHEEKEINLTGKITYTASDPLGKKNKHHRNWLHMRTGELKIKVFYDTNLLFEGIIKYSN